MFNRTLNRPMFRRGGRAGGGIMTGVQRPGYADDDNQLVEKSDMEKVQGNMESFNKAFPQYPYAASDFFMNLTKDLVILVPVWVTLWVVLWVNTLHKLHLINRRCSRR